MINVSYSPKKPTCSLKIDESWKTFPASFLSHGSGFAGSTFLYFRGGGVVLEPNNSNLQGVDSRKLAAIAPEN